ncbi:UDP-glycosyltransferase 75C1 [Sesamum alatum]|uniref:Glycosyltransferase n=1 Tax=Sesamum alatum TaxID=300844 RepID=A0AAE1YAM4_9LAMI|nr:UDP-glycosyltransferase 75C1 [Sesamum alatum]
MVHVLLVTFPGQGHINPSLQFAKRLSKLGAKVTFLTSLSAIRRMTITSSTVDGLIDFVSFTDGYDNGWSTDDAQNFMSAIRNHGSKAVEDAIRAKQEEGDPFTRVIYTLLVPWAGQVASHFQIPVSLLWIQPATVFGVYFYHFNKYFDAAGSNEVIKLPGLPVFELSDLPSFLFPSNTNVYDFVLPTFVENFQILDRENSPIVLVNTFQALEPELLSVIDKYKLMAIGPLIPSAFLDGKDPSDTSFGGDLIQKSVDYVQWLDSKEKLSVIYVAFGSYSELSKPQMEEIAKGLIENGRPFLWVIRGVENSEKLDEMLSCRRDLEKQGKIVPWCTQVEVLSHPSVGCFLTHCGWNSTLESLVSGVPMVSFPQWTDQTTNAKLIQDFWRTGVKVRKPEEGGVVKSDEIKRCLEIVMDDGERGEEMRRQARKWRDLAKEAAKEGGTSYVNLKTFADQVLGADKSRN